MKFQSPRGTEDVLPDDVYRWHFLEDTFRKLADCFGYREIRTPTFEETQLFTRSVGESSDIVTKEMYEFKDKGDRSMTLKPEGTAGVMRAVIEHSLCPLGTTARLFYITPIFRYERPQKGRLRESHQVGFELLGSGSPAADAEIIELTAEFYKRLGFGTVSVSLNSIGRAECRTKYKDVLLATVASFLSDQAEEFRRRVELNPLRLLDSKDPGVRAAIQEAPPITDFLEDAGRANYEDLQQRLTDRGVGFKLNPLIVRGLDYYTDTVFEVVSDALGAQNSLCGGGRYDRLSAELGGASTPSVGVAMGIERALIAMEELGINPANPRPEFFAIVASDEARVRLEQLAKRLRDNGTTVIFDLEQKNLKSQLKQATRYRARYALILGADELSKGTVVVRDLDAGSQSEIEIDYFLVNRESRIRD